MIASVISVLAVLIAGGWVIIELKIENAVSSATAQRNEDLAALKAAVAANEALLSARLIEVETQFRTEDQMRNVQWAEQRRILALLWEKEFGSRYPTEVQFYPSVAK